MVKYAEILGRPVAEFNDPSLQMGVTKVRNGIAFVSTAGKDKAKGSCSWKGKDRNYFF